MSASNSTTHYNLPIFVETDVPAWLVDFNGAMRAIDTAIYNNAQAIAGKESVITFGDSETIDLTRENNTVTAELNAAINEQIARALYKPLTPPTDFVLNGISPTNEQVNVTIGDGLNYNDNTETLTAADFNLIRTGSISISAPAGTNLSGLNLRYALNKNRSIGKIYGQFILTGLTANQAYSIPLPGVTVAATGAAYTIYGAGFVQYGRDPVQRTDLLNLTVAANGSVSIRITPQLAGRAVFRLYPCFYIFTDLGDTE